jgi:hypothetical protein
MAVLCEPDPAEAIIFEWTQLCQVTFENGLFPDLAARGAAAGRTFPL